jgi:hypothetical protein
MEHDVIDVTLSSNINIWLVRPSHSGVVGLRMADHRSFSVPDHQLYNSEDHRIFSVLF